VIGKAESMSDVGAKSRKLVEQSDMLAAKSRTLCEFDVQRTMVASIKTDLKVGLTFASIALQTHDQVKRQRNQTKARIAYDTVMRYCRSLHFSDDDKVEIESGQGKLRTALEQLGESL